MAHRWIAWCTVVAFLSLIPYAAEVADLNLPIWLRFALLPLAEGMHYMAVFFHEPGHALTHWLFGEPALPLLDPDKGGGMTYSIGRSQALTAFIYFLITSGMLLAMRRKRPRAAAAIAVFAVIHAFLIYSEWDLFVSLVMGHGVEIIAGSVMIVLAARPGRLKTPAERWVALSTGLHFFGRNALLCGGLLLNAAKRREYAMQKGIPGLGDYQQAANVIGVSVEAVSAGMLVFLLASAAVTLIYIRRGRQLSTSSV